MEPTAKGDNITTCKSIDDLLELNDSPIPLHVIPNYIGVNLSSVESVLWSTQPDGQLVELEIKFKPDGKSPPLAKMSFGAALAELKQGQRVARAGWNGKGMWLGLQRPAAHSKMSLSYIYMSTVSSDLVPWLASQTDMLAEDWVVVG